jgi:hypothetical protein
MEAVDSSTMKKAFSNTKLSNTEECTIAFVLTSYLTDKK